MKKYTRGKNPNSRNGHQFKKDHKPTYDGLALKEYTKKNGVWNKGTKGLMKSNSGSFKKGEHNNPNTEFKEGGLPKTAFKKGNKPWNKGKKGLQIAWNRGLDGEKSHSWKGGVTPFNSLLRSSSKFKIWRELVFLRDNFTCQNKDCKFCDNKIGVFLHPHHIKQLAFYPELAFKVDNGITYCAEYHLKSNLHEIVQKEC